MHRPSYDLSVYAFTAVFVILVALVVLTGLLVGSGSPWTQPPPAPAPAPVGP